MESKRTVFKSSFRHDGNKRGKPTPTSAPSSEPRTEKDGDKSSRRKSLRGHSPSGKLSRKTCRDYINGKGTRPSCDFWHPPECQNYNKKSGRRFGDKCAFIHQQVEGQPSRKPKKDCDEEFTTIGYRFYGRAQTFSDQRVVCKSRKTHFVM